MVRTLSVEQLRRIRRSAQEDRGRYQFHASVCTGAGCISAGSLEIAAALTEAITAHDLQSSVRITKTGCIGCCDAGPVVLIRTGNEDSSGGILLERVRPESAPIIVEEHLIPPTDMASQPAAGIRKPGRKLGDIPFFQHQQKIVLRHCGQVDPTDIRDYIAQDGYEALGKVLTTMSPQEVIDVIKASGLRGRGGAGFPTGMKWQFTRNAPGDRKFVVCNADEGDPGAFMDRSVLEGDPHSVLEAMEIAGYAVGAQQGYIYVRAEYPLAVERLGIAIQQAREMGLLGGQIFGTDFGFDVEIRIGAGAFVCGEETALLASIEGKRGMPRPRPPFPANEGLWGQPTVINNVETLANIAAIILRGVEWYTQFGTEGSRGTKVFALAGDINNTGLVEVPMGTTLGEIVYQVGGGIPGGRKFKAAQIGGPSGGCIPAPHLNVPLDYESVKELGAIMGSGGLIIMDEDTCMVDIARFFMEFVQDESCGKCVPCRLGTRQMLEILTRITQGEGEEGDIERLKELGWGIKDASLCGLGQTSPNPVLSTIRYFREEYEAHIRDKRCSAASCRALFPAPCIHTCPAEVNIPGYIALIAAGKYQEAVALIRARNPLPAICGRVCQHACESRCQRSQIDEPLAIDWLKRYVADWCLAQGYDNSLLQFAPRTDKSIAIIGSGPAGLSAAFYLACLGHRPVIYEALPIAGGMLAVGIPQYRLPREILDAEIQSIRDVGVDIHTDTRIGTDVSLAQLRSKHEAIFIAIGAHESRKLGIPDEEMPGVVPGTMFLRQANLAVKLGQFSPPINVRDKRVVVIGGGDVAIDAARSAVRLGAAEVHILYRRRREDMPAEESEIEEAIAEGIHIRPLVAPERILGDEAGVTGIEVVQMQLGAFDSSGRPRPAPTEHRQVFPADLVIPAIGQVSVWTQLEDDIALQVTSDGTFAVDPEDLTTNVEGIFAGGDVVSGPATVIDAIALGRRAAIAIDRYLGSRGDLDAVFARTLEQIPETPGDTGETPQPRQEILLLPIRERSQNFNEVMLGFTEEQVRAEALRCLRCDLS